MLHHGWRREERDPVEDVRTTLAEIGAASERLMATTAKLTDEDLGEPSRLPGWTRGHVLAHVVRNTDSCWNLLEWARTGAENPQYPSDASRREPALPADEDGLVVRCWLSLPCVPTS
jgi:uncharacterized protein (TIGR03083 family)